VLLGLVAAGTALGGSGGLGPPDAESPNAGRISDAYWAIAIFTGFIFVVVEGALIVFIVRFRRRGRPRTAEGPQIHGSTRLELIWTVLPVVILVLIGGFVFYRLPGIKDPPASAASNRLDVRIEGRQFYWRFTYPNGVVAIDKLRVPVGRVTTFDITAPDWDVIHSWWIPRLAGKMDAIPGKVNHMWIQPKEAGVYRGQCAELCGLFHATMKASVQALPAAEFDRWLASAKTAQASASKAVGKEAFQGVCLKCHRLSGAALFGPSIGGNPLLKDAKGLETLIRNGRGLMPPVAKGWSDAEVRALVAYTKTLGSQSGG
jgi:cytochrome c oxidase subunit 2